MLLGLAPSVRKMAMSARLSVRSNPRLMSYAQVGPLPALVQVEVLLQPIGAPVARQGLGYEEVAIDPQAPTLADLARVAAVLARLLSIVADGAVMLLFFLLTGRWLDSVMRDRARDGVTALLQHRSAGAWTLDADGRAVWTDVRHALPMLDRPQERGHGLGNALRTVFLSDADHRKPLLALAQL